MTDLPTVLHRQRALLLAMLALMACRDESLPLRQEPDLGIADADCARAFSACGRCAGSSDCLDPALPECYERQCVACTPSPDSCPLNQVCRRIGGALACAETCGESADCAKLGGGSLCCAGSCVNPAEDPKNCGACGSVCRAAPNAARACLGGHCVGGSCNAGFADCDQLIDNGCEVELAGDNENCGVCGVRCAPLIGVSSSFCVGGQCTCAMGRANCDGNAKNGCESELATDARNCGACGSPCPLAPNALSSKCGQAQCSAVCQPGFADCDGMLQNGCEVNLRQDPNACAKCAHLCRSNNAIANCSMGICTLQCNPGFVDCDMDGATGCEADIRADNKNCGACGIVCPKNVPNCVGGKCM